MREKAPEAHQGHASVRDMVVEMKHHHQQPRAISRCRVNGSENLIPVLSLGTQKLTGVFPREREQKTVWLAGNTGIWST